MPTAQTLVMPKLGLTMTEGTVTTWRARAGERFSAGDVLVVVETDKVACDVEAPHAGILDRILIEETQTVPVGTPIAEWRAGGSELSAAPSGVEQKAMTVSPASKPAAGATPALARPTLTQTLPAPPATDRRISTPLARRLAKEKRIDLAHVQGSGPRGRIQAADIEAAFASRAVDKPDSPASSGITAPTATQRATAERLAASKRDTPHFYLAVDIEVSTLLTARAELNSMPDRPHVSLTHLIVAASVHALRLNPQMSRVWTDGGIRAMTEIDIGLAVDTERGLMNPIARNLGNESFYGLVRKVDDVVARARAGNLKMEDFGGGSVTISNAGMHDVRYMTSIIAPGQSAILGVGAIQECFRPDAAGAPCLRREIGVVLSADHRIHTGVGALAFLKTLQTVLATPMLLLLLGPDWGNQ